MSFNDNGLSRRIKLEITFKKKREKISNPKHRKMTITVMCRSESDTCRQVEVKRKERNMATVWTDISSDVFIVNNFYE